MTTKPSSTDAQMERQFSTEESCKTYLTQLRWPDGKAHCPRCGLSLKVYALKARPFHWLCKHCHKNGYRFSVLTGTIFENTNVPLRTWFRVIYKMTQSKKGISALQVYRMMDPVRGKKGSYRTAWYMCHRIRAAMQDETFRKLTGVVEVDETAIGGKERFKHKAKRDTAHRGFSGKVSVIGAIARKGNVVAEVVEQLDHATMHRFVRKAVSPKVSLMATDEHPGYQYALDVPHATVEHGKEEYVRGVVHTQNIDSFWSLLKRGIVGSFHHVSKKYLPLYVNEFTFRHNQRGNPGIFDAVLAGC